MNANEQDVAIRLRVIDDEIANLRASVDEIRRFGAEGAREFKRVGDQARKTDADIAHMSSTISGPLNAAAGLIKAAIGGMTVRSFLMAGQAALNAADNINDMSKRLGISTESLSQYGHVAKLSGASIDSFAVSMKYSQRAIAEAVARAGGARTMLRGLGLDARQLAQMKPEAAFEAIGDAISKLPTPAARTAAAMKLFGRAGTEMIPVFADGAEAVRAAREQFDSFGGTLDKISAGKAAAVNDSIDNLKAALQALAREIAVGAGPTIESWASGLTAAASNDNMRRRAWGWFDTLGDDAKKRIVPNMVFGAGWDFDGQNANRIIAAYRAFVAESKEIDKQIEGLGIGGIMGIGANRMALPFESKSRAEIRLESLQRTAKSLGIAITELKVNTSGARITSDRSADDLRKAIQDYYESNSEAATSAARASALAPRAKALGITIKRISVSTTGAPIMVDKTPEELLREIEDYYRRLFAISKGTTLEIKGLNLKLAGDIASSGRRTLSGFAAGMREIEQRRKSFDVIKVGVVSLAQAIDGSLVNAIMDSKAKLLDIESIGKQVFATLVSGLLNLGLSYILPPGLAQAATGMVKGRALGGPAYGPTIVGEYGPEMVWLPKGSNVTPSNKTAAMLSGGGDNVTIDARTTVVFPRGSTVFLDSPVAKRRLAEMVTREAEQKVNRTYRSRRRSVA